MVNKILRDISYGLGALFLVFSMQSTAVAHTEIVFDDQISQASKKQKAKKRYAKTRKARKRVSYKKRARHRRKQKVVQQAPKKLSLFERLRAKRLARKKARLQRELGLASETSTRKRSYRKTRKSSRSSYRKKALKKRTYRKTRKAKRVVRSKSRTYRRKAVKRKTLKRKTVNKQKRRYSKKRYAKKAVRKKQRVSQRVKSSKLRKKATPKRRIRKTARSTVKGKTRFSRLIAKHASKHGIPVKLAHAVVRVESNYRPHVRGGAGEIGLMQIKPATARGMGFRGSVKALYNPETNIKYGMKYLAGAYKRAGGSLCGTILRYNAGHYAKRMNPISARYCRKVKKMIGHKWNGRL